MTSFPNPMADRLRELLVSPAGIELPGCYDALSAMILDRAGFPAVFMSGYGIAASLLGSPDIGLTSLVETSLMVKNITGAIGVPLVVDADNGYGDEDSVVRTVYELERAGAAAMILEDQVFPKRCGHAAGKSVIPLDRYLRKLECALEARRTTMVVVARTDATSMDEGIARAQRFHAAGADVTLVDGLPSTEALRRVGEEVPGHKIINLIHGGKTPLLASEELHALGFKIVLYSTPALYTAARTMFEAMARLAETRELGSISDASMTFCDFQAFLESQYFRRSGSAGLARIASNAAAQPAPASAPSPASYVRLQAVRFEPEERRTGSGR
ncbi:MAG: isocitrate lyase/PEP mutase family protein [Polyangiaceae bacterium]